MEPNPILEKLPRHLLDLAIEQPFNEYTAQDHAVWRYVMRRNVSYLSKVAHESYVQGLARTGITLERIPSLVEMNRSLGPLGWAAISVDGFIPPAAFMELQGWGVLPIAADIRPIEQINYTPAPDIIHEAAGHAPIIADVEYAEYLKAIGRLGAKAFSSALNHETYEAIRLLSILKADPYAPPDQVLGAEKRLAALLKQSEEPSEMTRIRNLHWWTVEYGLIGDLGNPRIYGAGLLSSIGESFHCLQDQVKKIPYTLDAMNYDFDITTEQPQLFVTPDFRHLSAVLREFEKTMAVTTGGLTGLEKAAASGSAATAVYSSGLQVSGVFTEVIAVADSPAYLRTTGPTILCFRDRQLPGHGVDYHAHGFGAPAGLLRGSSRSLELWSDHDLRGAGLTAGSPTRLEFASGVTVAGSLKEVLRQDGKLLVLRFVDCEVRHRDRVLFEPRWGTYDMAVGEKIVSVFSGPADPAAYGLRFAAPKEKTHKIRHSEKARALHAMYRRVRDWRESGATPENLGEIWDRIERDYPDEWLLPLEIVELAEKAQLRGGLLRRVRASLEEKADRNSELQNLIENGLALIEGRNER